MAGGEGDAVLNGGLWFANQRPPFSTASQHVQAIKPLDVCNKTSGHFPAESEATTTGYF